MTSFGFIEFSAETSNRILISLIVHSQLQRVIFFSKLVNLNFVASSQFSHEFVMFKFCGFMCALDQFELAFRFTETIRSAFQIACPSLKFKSEFLFNVFLEPHP